MNFRYVVQVLYISKSKPLKPNKIIGPLQFDLERSISNKGILPFEVCVVLIFKVLSYFIILFYMK